ncbi:orotidine-5'-phosphate decarboxylase [bacterium]|nr:orotidine-5'-phosphate decarboxylase [bacterium]
MSFYKRLDRATSQSRVCVGLDPVLEKLPHHLKNYETGTVEFLSAIVEATAPFTAAYKPNLAFFEALGTKGEYVLQATIDSVRKHAPNAIVIGDGKRNDIGSTAERYAIALFERFGFDAVTVNPYLGWDGIEPFTKYADRGVILLALTSNPSGGELQDHGGEDDPLYLKVAQLAEKRWNINNNIGLVVGATKGEKMARVREAAPSLPFLVPGIGAQGGDLQAVIQYSMGKGQPSGVVNSSRGIIYASSGEDFAQAAAREAEKLQTQINDLLES